MSTLPTVLVTGFEPFGGDRLNPSWEIASRLDGWVVTDFHGAKIARVRSQRLPCVFGEALAVLEQALARWRPVAVVGLGLAGSREEISVERIAINIDDARIPDNAGRQPIDQPVHAGEPAAYWSTLPIKAIVAALHEAGIPAAVSQSAGTFVCNHVFYGLAHRLASRHRARRVRAGFIHVPWVVMPPYSADHDEAVNPSPPGRIDLNTAVAAIRIAVQVTLNHGEVDLALVGGALD